MEKTAESSTQDFTNVESFSQLPFIRPSPSSSSSISPSKDKLSCSIRLFGIDFTGTNNNNTNAASADEDLPADTAPATAATTDDNSNNNCPKDANETTSEIRRKFECHYCCRNFPTSQALGGHQNAHKRERQHAKRAHLQSMLLHADAAAAATAHHVYGPLMNYHHRLGHIPHPPPPPPPPMAAAASSLHFPSWGSTGAGGSYHHNTRYSYYSAHNSSTNSLSQTVPINGNPLPVMWRIPGVQSQAVVAAPAANCDLQQALQPVLPLLGATRENSKTGGGGFESKNNTINGQDHVSLDLHL